MVYIQSNFLFMSCKPLLDDQGKIEDFKKNLYGFASGLCKISFASNKLDVKYLFPPDKVLVEVHFCTLQFHFVLAWKH